jgi:2-oxoglutarate dehydrogenase E2 component (dihydrolipoamide succinyltransferase)
MDVVMPQMGESIAEGTIVRWIKKVGDTVDRDEPLFEISTDKVDAEIPSPAAGVIAEIRAKEGETVPVNSVVAVIGPAGAAAGAPGGTPATPLAPPQPEQPPAPRAQGDGAPATASAPPPEVSPQAASRTAAAPPQSATPAKPPAPAAPPAEQSVEGVLRQRSSPLVRRIAKEHNVDISQIRGTGIAGRVTKDDILGFIEGPSSSRQQTAARAPEPATASRQAATQTGPASTRPATPSQGLASGAGLAGQRVPMSVMRKRISEHMTMSKRTSAHVHSVFEINFHRVAQIRAAKKAEYERAGAKLTYLSFIVKACVDALRAVPVVNASIDGETIVYHQEVNVGIAVALDWGLIVPVIKNADEKNLLGLSRAIADLASRARSKQLKPEEVSGGTFTITNPGVFGALFGMPIINQPQLAIVGVGNVEKRPVVIDDAIAIRPMAYLSIGYDHRVIDGAVADEFMSHVKQALENWDPSAA